MRLAVHIYSCFSLISFYVHEPPIVSTSILKRNIDIPFYFLLELKFYFFTQMDVLNFEIKN